jgi:hypothetical protein
VEEGWRGGGGWKRGGGVEEGGRGKRVEGWRRGLYLQLHFVLALLLTPHLDRIVPFVHQLFISLLQLLQVLQLLTGGCRLLYNVVMDEQVRWRT